MCDFRGVTLARAHAPFLPAQGNYANMTSVDFAWVVCLNMLSFVPRFFLGTRLSPTSLIMTQTQRDSSALRVLFGILRLFGILFTHARGGTADTYNTTRSKNGSTNTTGVPVKLVLFGILHFLSRTLPVTLLIWYPFVLSTNQNEPPPQFIQLYCIKLKIQ